MDAAGGAYRGHCSICGHSHVLPSDEETRAAARTLLEQLSGDPRFEKEGKMLGVLRGRGPRGESVVLHAFSGMLDGAPFAEGFVGPTRPARLTEAAETRTLAELERLREEIRRAEAEATCAEHARDSAAKPFDEKIAVRSSARHAARNARAGRRSAGVSITEARQLEVESQREGIELRQLRRERAAALAPAERRATVAREECTKLRRARRNLSRQLQADMHATHGLVNFAGRYATLASFFGTGVPTGTGECCAPKLLQEAALRGVQPIGVAEIWCGPPPPSGRRLHGHFYAACREKCAPILGHLLCGMDSPQPPIHVLYEDDHVIAVDKPAGLLSVPGRTSQNADSVETRLEALRPGTYVRAAHRLDQATSGVLLLARSRDAHRKLSETFARAHAQKHYWARVSARVGASHGVIDLPLGPDPMDRPRQRTDEERGRPARTRFRVLERHEDTTDLLLEPTTGRTHQLRVHCADPRGLGAAIVGDALYGGTPHPRLLLHAECLRLPHPHTGAPLEVRADRPQVASCTVSELA